MLRTEQYWDLWEDCSKCVLLQQFSFSRLYYHIRNTSDQSLDPVSSQMFITDEISAKNSQGCNLHLIVLNLIHMPLFQIYRFLSAIPDALWIMAT